MRSPELLCWLVLVALAQPAWAWAPPPRPAPASGGAGAPYRATVLSVGDGDSLRVRHDGQTRKLRLACIDAPERAQAPYGERSRAYLITRLPIGRSVWIRPVDTDRYGRTVAEVIGDINVGLAMVEDGWAFVHPRHGEACAAEEYRQAELRASRHRYGLWQQPGGIERPWQFRRGHRR
jgi:endonuclease YncB( thermonuclease family)